MTNATANARIRRYRSQSLRLLEDALAEMRGSRWLRTEELLWGSLTLAVKGVALSRNDTAEDDAAVKAYAVRLGNELRDRRIREAFDILATLGDTLERARESRRRVDSLFQTLDDISAAVERLWDLVDGTESAETTESQPVHRQRGRKGRRGRNGR